ncbi:MAG: hypothetical protein LHV68_06650 [Elusimicrobia bacterium]|nr:hypothetical protein [Candidatus Liberimonas magnetica]
MNTKEKITILIVALLLLSKSVVTVFSVTSATSSNMSAKKSNVVFETAMSLYEKGMVADKAGDSKRALYYFKKALMKDDENTRIINMLAHSERKLGMLNEAVDDFWKAIILKHRFPEVDEYTASYTIATIKEIKALKSYGVDENEYE